MKSWDVMLVDGDRLFCAALGALLSNSQFQIAAEYICLTDAVAAVRSGRRTDLILLNLQTGQPEELSQLKQMRALASEARIVVLASDLAPQILTGALQAGADGCLNKTMSCEALQRSLHLVMLGEAVFPRSIADLLISTPMENFAPANPAVRWRRVVEARGGDPALSTGWTIQQGDCPQSEYHRIDGENAFQECDAENPGAEPDPGGSLGHSARDFAAPECLSEIEQMHHQRM